jgi:hypothetical protein
MLLFVLAATPAASSGPAASEGLAQLEADRDASQGELARLGQLIATKKAALPPGAEAGPELTELLRASAALAAKLEALQQRIAAGEEKLRQSHGAVIPVPGVPAQVGSTEGDDARSLQEKADFLRDREDALRTRIAAVSRRIEALGRERALARRVSEFAREQDLFNDDDRRVAVTHAELSSASPSQGAAQVDTSRGSQNPTQMGGGGAGGVGTTPSGSGGNGGGGGMDNGNFGSLAGMSPPAAAPGGGESPSSVRQTFSGERPEEVRTADLDDVDSIEDLRVARAALEREAEQLHRKAEALEKSASEGR